MTRGKLADIDSASQPLSDAGRQKLHESIEATYASFVSKVATARKKSYAQIDPIAQGRVWMGTQALQNGLVDQLGGLNRAIAMVRQRAHLSATGETNLVIYPRGARSSKFSRARRLTPLRRLWPSARSGELFLVCLAGRYSRAGSLHILPYQFRIQYDTISQALKGCC